MLTILVAGSIFFPGLFLLSKRCLKHAPGLRWSEGDAVIVSARLVSSIQAIMASTAGYIIATSCEDIIEDQHWLTSSYILFAVPYFVYDIYAMFMCYWYKLQVKGHEDKSNPRALSVAFTSYLRREFLMVLHHVVMVTVCFPVSVFWRQGRGDYFQGVMFLAEVSTPSVCLGKILIQVRLHPALHGAILSALAVQPGRRPPHGPPGLLVLPHLSRGLPPLRRILAEPRRTPRRQSRVRRPRPAVPARQRLQPPRIGERDGHTLRGGWVGWGAVGGMGLDVCGGTYRKSGECTKLFLIHLIYWFICLFIYVYLCLFILS
ncbi:TLC domain containing 3Ba isoform X1 [Scleropages formosus]|uniref:TLC domain containing 3Ba isoform X1 n=1 Tax=Scleropages formosus TaxID=113540 RepID=UPI0010FA78FF|nr:protein FAM57B isoform X1 [Scleropages formosus]